MSTTVSESTLFTTHPAVLHNLTGKKSEETSMWYVGGTSEYLGKYGYLRPDSDPSSLLSVCSLREKQSVQSRELPANADLILRWSHIYEPS